MATNITKEQLQQKLSLLDYKVKDLEQKLKVAQEEAETHKRASFEQNRKEKEKQLERDTIKQDYEKLTKAYNGLAQLFDEYVQVSKNSLQQLQGLTQASAMLEQNVTQKIINFNKGVESK